MARRSRLRGMPSGNPILARMSRAEARLDDHEARLDAHDRELHEVDLDIAQLTDIVLRASRRARARLLRRRRLAHRRRNRV